MMHNISPDSLALFFFEGVGWELRGLRRSGAAGVGGGGGVELWAKERVL